MQTKKISKKKAYWISVAIVGVVIGFALQVTIASWTPPTQTAPGGNVAAPLTTSAIEDQIKKAGLTIGSSGHNIRIGDGAEFCIKGECISQWADVSSPHVKVFDANGQFTVPSGVSQLIVEGWGAGGGGSGYAFYCNQPSTYFLGYGGGSGAYGKVILNVSAGNTLDITIGKGGTGVYSNGAGGLSDCYVSSQTFASGSGSALDGGDGGSSSVGSLVSFAGGTGGKLWYSIYNPPNASWSMLAGKGGGQPIWPNPSNPVTLASGHSLITSSIGNDGSAGTTVDFYGYSYYYGGNGGSAPNGGAGGQGLYNAPGNTPGGGGGGGTKLITSPPTYVNGAKGADGKIIIYY